MISAEPLPPSAQGGAISAARTAVEAALADAPAMDLSWLRQEPPSDGVTMAPDALRFLMSLVAHYRPEHILELGSGLSTRAMAVACSRWQSSCRISSVDHDPQFGGAAARELAGQREECHVQFQIAPLVARDYGGKWLPVYHLDPERLASPRLPDLVVIDGPPSVLGGREGSLYQTLDLARVGTLVVMDDARHLIAPYLGRWQENLGEAIELSVLPGFQKGLATVIVRRPVRKEELGAHRFDLTEQELTDLIPPQDPLILVDDGFWRNEEIFQARALSFLDGESMLWCPPSDGETAIREIERLRRSGAEWVVFGWPAFWWLQSYPCLYEYLHRQFRCALQNDRVVVFGLNP